MTSIITKRHQARNERALQDLIRNVPGNDRCADCSARNPGWASWSLGIFLCMRCAALHRKLGTHLSKVKSLSMDAWTAEQVENMKKLGNTASNRQYNPRNVKPEMPLDPDEIDMAMEKFIRQKYQHRTLGEPSARTAKQQNTGSTSSEDPPPPLPPKPTQRFAPSLRAVSSTFSRRKDRPLPPINASENRRGSFEEKMYALKEMGFPDEKRNATVLRGLDGNVEKTVEALIKLGEKNGKDKAAASGQRQETSPSTATRGSAQAASNAPLSSIQEPVSDAPLPVSTAGAFFQSEPLPQRNNSFNPFDPSYQPNQTISTPLETSFENLHVAPQPLFPNHTGSWQQQPQHNPFFKSYTPPIYPTEYQHPPPSSQPLFFGPANGQWQPISAQSTGSNPFLRTTRSQSFSPSNPYNQQQAPFEYTTLQAQPTDPSMPPVPPLPSWTQNVRSSSHPPLHQSQVPPMQAFGLNQTNSPAPLQSPFHEPAFQNPQSYEHQAAAEYPFQPVQLPQQQAQGQLQQPTHGKIDKNSILALYNQPRRELQQPAPTAAANAAIPMNAGQQGQQPLRNATFPPSNSNSAAPESRNPFANLAASSVNGTGARPSMPVGYASRESADFASLMTGRHSPDAFASLSARYG